MAKPRLSEGRIPFQIGSAPAAIVVAVIGRVTLTVTSDSATLSLEPD